MNFSMKLIIFGKKAFTLLGALYEQYCIKIMNTIIHHIVIRQRINDCQKYKEEKKISVRLKV